MVEINEQCRMTNYQLAMQDQKGSMINSFILLKTMICKIRRTELPLRRRGVTPPGFFFSLLIAN
jgi:hypothetical protein